MIKKIHYCWFGGKKPELVKNNIETWAVLNPDYEIKEWNETNSNLENNKFAQNALKNKKWAFVSDIARLHALLAEGGFYFDTDVELCRPLRELNIPKDKLTMGYMYDCALGTAVMYAPPNHYILKNILNLYEYVKEECYPVNNTIFTDYFINNVSNFLLNGKKWENEFVKIFPKEFFEQPAFIRTHGFSIHHCSNSWMPTNNGEIKFDIDKVHFIKWLKRKINTAIALHKNEFYPYYKAARKGISLHKPYNWMIESKSHEHLKNS